jgi:hypothetical protein
MTGSIPVIAQPLIGGDATQMSAASERKMKHWQEQRWIHDAVVKTVGVEWDQGRIGCAMKPCGPEATLDFGVSRPGYRSSLTLPGNSAAERSGGRRLLGSLMENKKLCQPESTIPAM